MQITRLVIPNTTRTFETQACCPAENREVKSCNSPVPLAPRRLRGRTSDKGQMQLCIGEITLLEQRPMPNALVGPCGRCHPKRQFSNNAEGPRGLLWNASACSPIAGSRPEEKTDPCDCCGRSVVGYSTWEKQTCVTSVPRTPLLCGPRRCCNNAGRSTSEVRVAVGRCLGANLQGREAERLRTCDQAVWCVCARNARDSTLHAKGWVIIGKSTPFPASTCM